MKHLTPLLALLAWTVAAPAQDWSQWRGPEQNGVSRARNLPEKFSLSAKAEDNNLIWRVPYGGISTPIVQQGRVYVINRIGEGVTQQERVMCFDEADGKVLWQKTFNVFLTDIVRDRLGWSSMVGDPETGYVYAHGTQGFLLCFNKDGEVVWRHSLTEEYGRVSGYGGRLTNPVVDGNLVLLSMVNADWGELTIGGSRLVAFDKRTGDVVWWGSNGHRVVDTYYATPVTAVVAGERLVLNGGGDGGVHAFRVRTGEKVWSYIFGNGAVNCSAVVQGDRIYIGHGEENENGTQGRVICLDASKVANGKPRLVWQVDGIKAKFASPILHEGRLYVCNEVGTLFCLNADDGKELWNYEYGKNTKGSPVLADGKIYVSEVDSRFHILKPGADGCTQLYSQFFRPVGGVPVELNGSPAVANGRVYFLTSHELICIGKKGARPEYDKVPPEPAEAAKGTRPAHLQVVPADVSLHPGESVELKALAFDEHGQALGEVAVDWSLAGQLPPVYPVGLTAPPPPKGATPPPPLAGTLAAPKGTGTKLTAAKGPPAQFGRVVARAGDLTAFCRVRVAPVLPYQADFSKVPEGRFPAGWVNTGGKFSVVQLPDGKKVLSKRNDNANILVARAHPYLGLPDLKDYTIEADVFGTRVRNELPDVGVHACRYTLVLAGNTQTLRLYSWDALPRIEKNLPWEWKPDVWYRMKLRAEVRDGQGLIRGKVWPRDHDEPADWSIEVTDPVPNTEGSPALYGFATSILGPTNPGTNIYYDNVRIYPNKK